MAETPKWYRESLRTSTLIGLFLILVFVPSGCMPVASKPVLDGKHGATPVLENKHGATLVLEDEHGAAWMHIDNAFSENYGTAEWNPWDGVLFQFGEFYAFRVASAGPPPTYAYDPRFKFGGILIVGTTGRRTFGPKDFRWINVVADDARKPPLTTVDAGLLNPTVPVATFCSQADACPSALPHQTPTNWNCAKEPLTSLAAPCMRRETIHAFLRPTPVTGMAAEWFGILTYWTGRNGYDLTAREKGGDGDDARHFKLTFTMNDRVQVWVWNGVDVKVTATKLTGIGEIREIRIAEPDITNHGQIHEPPIGMGKTP